ncbi:MAG: MOSC domain-containing protein [Candidatus Omnitrophica bacterium CG11_big_fil_rev_8_21_14_0_20_42_13]|uniref:MOSC domain-containing protein n=1 Tax=Candidatus Ghiorseimicrobium undicola TaxID=1974746 RepID=A0A2H0LXY4_9BACT|nr:MAG: MOSC domain-containing protein [Candidatus Omnitrophica bacterium CG11_big_fil_rev_8_21_14_0_20_42_13]
MENSGKIFSINISAKKGIPKTPVKTARLIENFGIEGDVHAGDQTRQVSLLSWENICRHPKLKPGDFAENITTAGINLKKMKIGDKILIGEKAILEITQLGKECHSGCVIQKETGKCIMPKLGIFAKVIKGGGISTGSTIVKI